MQKNNSKLSASAIFKYNDFKKYGDTLITKDGPSDTCNIIHCSINNTNSLFLINSVSVLKSTTILGVIEKMSFPLSNVRHLLVLGVITLK
jgi:hypothetical protein